MIRPKPFKLRCPKCGYSKVVAPKSDVLNPLEMINICPKCKTTMEREELNILDKLFITFRRNS